MSDGNGARQEVPYKELDYFEENIHDRERFAGRDHDIEEVVARISSTRAFVLYGRSGLGKTSLLLSGVFPILRKEGFLPIYVRTLDQPLQGLEKILRHPCSGLFDSPARDDESLEDLLRRAGGKSIPVLVFDQFEEFFTRFALRTDGFLKKRRDRTEFVNRICALVLDLARDIRIVFSLREDYLHTLDAFQRRLPNLFSTAYRLLPLTADGARDAIIRPLRRDGVAFDQRAVTGLVDQLAEFDFESARLQVASSELYLSARGARDGKVSITADDLGRLKEHGASGLSGVFKRYLQAAIEHIEERWHLLARALLDVLFLAKGTKFALSSRELVDYQFGTALETLDVLRQLTRQKILRRERRDGRTWFELRHECLVEPIEEWLNESESFGNYRQVRDIIKANARGGRFRTHPEMLLSTDQLDRLVSPNKERFRLSAQEIEFVTLSAIYERSADVGWWADKMGKEETEKLLTGLLADESNHKMLLGAAEAVGKAGFQNRDISQRCLAMALNKDTPSEVQRAAGLSFATIAGMDEITALRAMRGKIALGKNFRALLGDLYEKDRLRGHFNLATRFMGRRQWERRLFDQRIASLREISGEATTGGGQGGGVWAATIGLVLALVIGNASDSLGSLWSAFVLLLMIGMGFGLLMGHLYGTSAAQELVIHKYVDWGRATRRQFGVSLSCAFFPFGLALELQSSLESWMRSKWGQLPDWEEVVTVFLVGIPIFAGGTLVFYWALSWAVSLCRCVMVGEKRWRALFWSIPTLVTVGLLPTMVVHKMTFMLEPMLSWTLMSGFLVFGLIMTGAVGALNTIDETVREPVQGGQRRRRNLLRAFSLVGVACVFPCFVWLFGWDCFPRKWSSLRQRVSETGGVINCSTELKMWPSISRVAIQTKSLIYSLPRYLTDSASDPASAFTVNGANCDRGFVFFPEHEAVIAFHAWWSSEIKVQKTRLIAERAQEPGPDVSVRTMGYYETPVLLQFTPRNRDENGRIVWATAPILGIDGSNVLPTPTLIPTPTLTITPILAPTPTLISTLILTPTSALLRRPVSARLYLYEACLTREAGQGEYLPLIEKPYDMDGFISKYFRPRSKAGPLSSYITLELPIEANGSLNIPFRLVRNGKSNDTPFAFSMVVGFTSQAKKD